MHQFKLLGVTSILLAAGSLAGCLGSDPGATGQPVNRRESSALSWDAFLKFEEPHSRMVNGERVYIVEWDMPMRESELHDYYLKTFVDTTKSTVAVLNAGGDNVWSPAAKLVLTYCVSTGFGTNYARMQAEVARATSAWTSSADVTFIYKPTEDANCVDSNTAVEIPVQPYSGGGACSFFPSDDGNPSCTTAGRALVVDLADIDSWPTTPIFGTIYPNLTSEGTLRHELGHIIGLRHEQIRDPANAINNCVNEVTNPGPYRALNAYDNTSVMQYPWCNGVVTTSLSITTPDMQGAISLYGAPAWTLPVLFLWI